MLSRNFNSMEHCHRLLEEHSGILSSIFILFYLLDYVLFVMLALTPSEVLFASFNKSFSFLHRLRCCVSQ